MPGESAVVRMSGAQPATRGFVTAARFRSMHSAASLPGTVSASFALRHRTRLPRSIVAGMMRSLAVLLVLSAASWSADLSKIDRRIAKVPRYSAATQYYGLLVLGDDAKYRVWFVVDGDTLYLDKNGDGDLRDPRERIPLNRKSRVKSGFNRQTRTWNVARLDKAGRYTHVTVNLSTVNREFKPDSRRRNINLLKARMKAVRAGTHPNQTRIEVTIGVKRRQFCLVRFATRASDAPIAHMDGPLTLGIISPLMDFQFGLGQPLSVGVGTPGLGTGAFSFVRYDELPAEARPFAIVTFPGLKPKRYDLKDKC